MFLIHKKKLFKRKVCSWIELHWLSSMFMIICINVFYFNVYICYQNPSNKNKDNVELRFYSVVTCLTQPILHNVFQSSLHALTIRYRNDLNLGVLFHYWANFTFLCVVKNEQKTDSLGLSGQNQDDELHRWEQIEWLLTPGCFYIV